MVAARTAGRIGSIDALRGLVMLLMLVDHVREFFYLHAQVRDPMDLAVTPPGLFLTRAVSHICAPVFLLLTGLSASLYAAKHGSRATASGFLLKRGLFLVLLEVTLVNVAWTGSLVPPVLYLQVIWAIGLSMIALAGLLWLPRTVLVGVAVTIMLGHDLLSPFTLSPPQDGYTLWAILHQRGLIDLPWGAARTSYPILPWIGVIAAGYALGPLFARSVSRASRRGRLMALGVGALGGFTVLRCLNGYGDPVPWQTGDTAFATALSIVNLTKYPASADFLLLTLGLGLILLALFETLPDLPSRLLSTFGGAPLFFYVAHLYLLRLLSWSTIAAGIVDGTGRARVGGPLDLWLIALVVALAMYPLCRGIVGLKRTSASPWMSYV